MGLQGKKIAQMKLELQRLDYKAGGGKEAFLSFEEKDGKALAGFIRLRIPNEPHRSEITPETALIRELHVYGQAMPIGESAVSNEGENKNIQDRGLGAQLLAEAERIARDEFGEQENLVSFINRPADESPTEISEFVRCINVR
jgi:elongator complex protein 3